MQLLEILTFMAEALKKAWPFILISIPLSVAVNLSGAGKHIKSIMGKNPLVSIVLATLFGALSPLCSCTVIPVIFSLLTAGVPLGPVMSFWIASPSMDPEIFFLSVSALGWNLAIWRLAATFVLSLAAGLAAHFLTKSHYFTEGILRKDPNTRQVGFSDLFNKIILSFRRRAVRPEKAEAACCGETPAFSIKTGMISVMGDSLKAASGGSSCCAPTVSVSDAHSSGSCCSATEGAGGDASKVTATRVLKETVDALVFVGKFMIIAYFIEALIVLYVPEAFIQRLLGSNGSVSIMLATAFGLPFYTTNLAALGLLGGLLGKGMVPGAALAFLISGPMTTLPAMSAVFGIAKPRVFGLYLSISFGGALFFGFLYNIIY